MGNIDTYTLNKSKRRQVAFQIALNPSVAQIGQMPILVEASILTAQDNFTNQSLNSSLGVLNTRFSIDPVFKDGDEKVSQ
jgi:hypothetical protein